MIHDTDIPTPAKELIERLSHISSATASGDLSRLGIRDAHIRGPVALTPASRVCGAGAHAPVHAKREDQYNVDEYADPEKQLHRHALYHTRRATSWWWTRAAA